MAEQKSNQNVAQIDKKKQLVVITGTSKGIGYHSAIKLIELGYIVAGCSRNAKKMKDMDAKYKEHSFLAVDVSDANQVQKWSEFVISKYGPPVLLINNAGVAAQRSMQAADVISNDDIHSIINVNIKGVMFVTKYFMKSMKENIDCPSKIIAISSRSGRTGISSLSPYCATKWAIEGFCKSVAEEVPDHMMCCAYDPGGIATYMAVYLFPELEGLLENAIEMGAIGPKQWAEECIAHILSLDVTKCNGEALERPNCSESYKENTRIYVHIKKHVKNGKLSLLLLNLLINQLEHT